MFKDVMSIANFIFIVLLILATITFAYRLRYIALGFKKLSPMPKSNVQKNFCILIPARNESNVITRLLNSLKQQKYDPKKFDVYVIVEDINDKSVSIAKSFGYNYFVRKDLSKVGKGFAIDECIQDIFEKKLQYDMVTIIDADNICAPNMLEEFNNAYCYGYKIGKACHGQINEPGNWIADCSTLTFAGVNTFQNKARTILGRNIIMSGSGLYVDFEIIKDMNGWKFTTLTEDYELSMYACINNIKTVYLPNTYCCDESPTTFSQSKKQRVRWIKGFFQVKKKYSKQLKESTLKSHNNMSSKLDLSIGVVPNILYIVSIILYLLFNLVYLIFLLAVASPMWIIPLKNFLVVVALTYLVLIGYTALQLRAEKEHLTFDSRSKIKILLCNPIFITLYVPFAIIALFKKNIGWQPIKHGIAKTNSNAEKLENNQDFTTEDEVSTSDRSN